MAKKSLAGRAVADIFQELAGKNLVLGHKGGEVSSVNAHGSFVLFPKQWDNGDEETLVGWLPRGQLVPPLSDTGEPLVHVHVADWGSVRLLRVEPFGPLKIGTDLRIGFFTQPPQEKMLFCFYASSRDPELADFLKNRRGDTPL